MRLSYAWLLTLPLVEVAGASSLQLYSRVPRDAITGKPNICSPNTYLLYSTPHTLACLTRLGLAGVLCGTAYGWTEVFLMFSSMYNSDTNAGMQATNDQNSQNKEEGVSK